MSEHLMNTVLPRLARPLYRDLEQFQTGKISELQFNTRFEELLSEEQVWLSRKGISAARAALLLHAGVLILSRPGLESEAKEAGVAFEVFEQRALREASRDLADRYRLKEYRVAARLAALIAKFEK